MTAVSDALGDLNANVRTTSPASTDAGLVTRPAPGSQLSIGDATGKTVVGVAGTLASTAVTADQVIATRTVTAGKTFFLELWDAVARLTTYAATSTLFGSVSLRIGGVKVWTSEIAHSGAPFPLGGMPAEPIPVAAGVVIDIVCTPTAVTAMTWSANILGYEK